MTDPGFWRFFPNVRSEERARFRFFGLVALFFTLAQTIGLAASEALFLAELGARQLPVAMLISAAAAVVASTLYAWQVGQQRNDRLFVGILAAGAMVVLAMLPLLSPAAARYGLLACFFVLQAVGLTHLRTFATDYFDTLASKRIFPLLAVAGSCGGFIGGCVAALLPRLADSRWLVLVWAIGLAVTAGWILAGKVRLRLWKPEAEEEDAPEVRQLRSAILWLRRRGLPRDLAFAVAAMVVAMSLLHYISSALLVESFTTAESLAAFLGLYLAASNIIEILIARWVTPWLLQRVGVPGAQLVHPILTAASFMALGAAPGLATAVLARADRELIENAFAGEVRNLAYNALPTRLRGSVRALVEGGVFYASFSLGGLTLILVGEDVSLPWLAVIGLAFVGLYGLGARRVAAGYLTRLRAALREGHLEVVGLEHQIGKPELAELASEWEEIVARPEEAVVTDAVLELAFVLARAGYHQVVARAIDHPAARLRIACVQALTESESIATAAATLVVALDDEEVAVRECAARALRSYAGTLPETLVAAARRHTGDPAPAVRAEVALALGGDGEELLLDLSRSEDSAFAVEALLRLPIERLGDVLARADDPEPRVQAAALSRLAELANTETLGQIDVTAALVHSDPRLRSAAVQVLFRASKLRAAAYIGAFLTDSDAGVRSTAMAALIELGADGVEAANDVALLAAPSASEAAFDVLAALAQCGGHQSLRRQLRRRVERAWCIQLAIETPAAGDSLAERFLHLALGNRSAQDVRAAFAILARLESVTTMGHIEFGLWRGPGRKRAEVLELLGNLGDRPASAALALLLEAGPLSEKRAQLAGWLRLHYGIDAIRSMGHECNDPWLEMAIANTMQAGVEPAPQEAKIMERLLALRRIPLFSHLSLDELSAIAAQTRVVSYLAGEIVVHEGESGDELYALLEGGVDAVINHGSPEEQRVNQLSAPDCFGEISILDGSPRSATIIVRSDARMIALPGNLLRDILRDVPQMAIDMLRALSSKLRAAEHRTTGLARELTTLRGAADDIEVASS